MVAGLPDETLRAKTLLGIQPDDRQRIKLRRKLSTELTSIETPTGQIVEAPVSMAGAVTPTAAVWIPPYTTLSDGKPPRF